MKVRDTSRGRMYAVSSNPGCTVINGDMAVDVPAGGQSVILALDKKLIIDGDDNAKFVEVRWGTNAAVGSRPAPSWMGDVVDGLTSIVGEGKFDVNYIPAENKLYLKFSLEVTTEQIEEVRSLLGRVLPSNVVTEIDEIPMTYTRLEYLESTRMQYINTGIKLSNESEVRCEFLLTSYDDYIPLFGGGEAANKLFSGWGFIIHGCRFDYGSERGVYGKKLELQKKYTIQKIGKNNYINEEFIYANADQEDFETSAGCYVFAVSQNVKGASRIYSFSIAHNNQLQLNFIPCLDDTGTPCMFDTVSRTPFRNSVNSDFIIGIETQQQLDNLLDSFPNYTGQAIEKLQINLSEALQTPENEARLAEAMAQNSTMPAMLSLDGEFVAPKFYAQLTEHGVRRLYHVPKGYIGTMDEYAAINGFKELVEPPMPMIGYWVPEWRETDTQLICEWVETEEPPTEEELQIEEIENA